MWALRHPAVGQPGHRPATKGRVERPGFYLVQHFSKGRSWPDMLALERDLARFESEWEQQPHQATGEPPVVRFERDERALLRPLPSGPFISSEEEFREVSQDCLVSYRSVRCSVPWPYASRRVWLRPSPGMYLEVRNQAGTVLCAGPATSESAYRRQIGLAPPDSGSEASPGRRTGVARWLPYTANGTGSHVLRWIRWLKVVTL